MLSRKPGVKLYELLRDQLHHIAIVWLSLEVSCSMYRGVCSFAHHAQCMHVLAGLFSFGLNHQVIYSKGQFLMADSQTTADMLCSAVIPSSYTCGVLTSNHSCLMVGRFGQV